jgi:anti-sigma B factor antagonist
VCHDLRDLPTAGRLSCIPVPPEEFSVFSPGDLGAPRPEKFLTIDARPRSESHVVLDVVGRVDACTAPLLQACLRTQLSRAGLRELVVDLGGVEFLGAAGVSTIVEAARRGRERGLRFRLRAHGRRSVLRPLIVAGLFDDLEVEPDVATLLPLARLVTHA